ncbi:hypothetical protein Tco_0698644 [Tanacetum coccineum]
MDKQVNEQCKFRFVITSQYIDEVICKVVPLDICHVIFGSPYLWKRNAVYFRRAQKYQFEKDGKKFLINRNNDVRNIELITACQARRMVNASQAVLISLARLMASSNKLQIMKHEKNKRHKKKDKQSKANESTPNGVGEHPNLNSERTNHITENNEMRSELESTQALVQKLLSENKNLVEKVNLLNAELDQKSATSRSSILVKPNDPMIKIHSPVQDITTHREKILFENTIVERKTSSTRCGERLYEDDDNESENVNKTREHGSHHPLKVEAKIDIPTYDGTIDAEKLDSWLDQLETYFTLYGFRSSDKHNLRLQRGQTVQEYTTEFRRLAMTLGIAKYSVDIFTKYVVGLPLQIQNEMRLHMITNISNASSIAMAIEQKNKDGGRKFEEGLKGDGALTKENVGRDDKSLSLMAKTHMKSLDTHVECNEKELFTMKIQVKHEVIEVIADTGSQKNLISASLVRKLGLKTTPHPSPYSLGWIKNDMDKQVNEQYEVICKVVPLDICHVIFGSPYLWERNAVYFRRAQKYQFEKDRKKFLINRNNDVGNIKLITACQARRMVNASQAVFLSLARPMASSNKLQIMEHEKKKRHKKKDKQSKANESVPNELESTQALVQKLLSEYKNLVEKVNLLNADLDQKSATSRSSILVKPYDPMIKIHSAVQDITTHREKILFENTIVERKTSSTRPSTDPLFRGKGRHDP